MKKAALLLLFVLCIIMFFFLFRTKSRPNFLFIVIDCWRADHFNPTDTPHLWELSKKGTVFEEHYANAGWTLPSMASLFSGQLPEFSTNKEDVAYCGFSRFGSHFIPLHGKEFETIPEKLVTFPEILKKNGYETIAVTMNSLTSDKIGYGSKTWDRMDYLPKDLGAEVLTDEAIKQLRLTSGKNRLIFVHYLDAHWPYDPAHKTEADDKYLVEYKNTKDEKRRRELVRQVEPLYTNAIRFIDEQVGRLLNEVDQKKFVLLVTADHGEMFMEEGRIMHPGYLPEQIVRVPLIVLGPGIPTGQKKELTQGIDVAATILRMAHIDPSRYAMPGEDVFSGSRKLNLVVATSVFETAYIKEQSIKRIPLQTSVNDSQMANELKSLGYIN